MQDHDEILLAAGGFGLYQWLLFIWWQVTVWVAVPNMGFMVFGGINATKECNKTEIANFNETDLNETSACDWVYHYHSVVEEWSLSEHLTATMTALQMVGVFFGPIIAGQISDLFGRKKTYLAFFSALIACGFASGFSNSWQLFMFFRVAIGLAAGGTISVHFVMYQEMILTKHRLIIYFGNWPLGYMFFGMVAYLVGGWRPLAIATNTFGLLPLALGVFWLTESPRWLIEKNRTAEAEEVFRTVARKNRVKSFDALENVFRHHEQAEKLVHAATPYTERKYFYWHLFPDFKMAAQTCAIVYSWVVTAAAYYAILLNIGSLLGDPSLNVIAFASVRLVINAVFAILDAKIPRLGRRLSHQISLAGLSLSFAAQAVVMLTGENKHAIFATAFLASAFCAPTWQAIEVYTAELFPTALRNMGNGLCNTLARVGSGFAPYLLLLSGKWPPATAVVFTVLTASNFIVAFFFLPETKGKPLPDISEWDK